MIETLENTLKELLQLREDLEIREESELENREKKELIQQIIDLTHQIQAVRVVIDLYAVDE